MEKTPPIPQDMVPCLGTYFTSKEFDDDLAALFEEVQQAEHLALAEKAAKQAESSQPSYDIRSVIQFFKNAIEDTDECKEILSKITDEQIEASVRTGLEDIRKASTGVKKENELNKKEIVELFKRMITKEFELINNEYFPGQRPVPEVEEVKKIISKFSPAEHEEPFVQGQSGEDSKAKIEEPAEKKEDSSVVRELVVENKEGQEQAKTQTEKEIVKFAKYVIFI